MVVLVSEEVPRIHWVQWLRHVAKREEHWSFFHPLDFSLFGNQTMMISMVSHSRKKHVQCFCCFNPTHLLTFVLSIHTACFSKPTIAIVMVHHATTNLVDTVDTVDTIYTVYTVEMVYTVYTVDMV